MKILFIDDEKNVLEGLKRHLYSMRAEWEMEFATNGEEALKILNENKFDAVISDLRMPGMNGLQLLKKIKYKHPDIIRIILSGYTDQNLLIDSIEVAHQYLTKPCNIETLKLTLQHTFNLKKTLKNQKLLNLIPKLTNLPVFPESYQKLLKELDNKEVSIKKISSIISNDISMSAKILHIVNSAFFGIPKKIENIEEAVHFIGLDITKALLLTFEVISQFDAAKFSFFPFKKLLNHSLTCANFAKAISKYEKLENIIISNSFFAGLFHDIGKLIIAINLPEEYKKIISLNNDDNISSYTNERKILGTSHAEIGAYLMNLWGFPDDIVDAIAYHHTPGSSIKKSLTPLTTVHTANYFYHITNNTASFNSENKLDEEYLFSIIDKKYLLNWQKIWHKYSDKIKGV